MRSHAKSLVYRNLAAYLNVDETTLRDSQGLAEDLGLDALDLALVAIGLEDTRRGATELPLQQLADVRTVAGLVTLFESWWYGGPVTFDEGDEDEVPPTLRYA